MSALDARMRTIAREELAAAEGAPPTADEPNRVTELEQQIAALTTRVDELEKATAPAPAVKRAARKTASESGE